MAWGLSFAPSAGTKLDDSSSSFARQEDSGKCLRTFKTRHPQRTVAISPDGRFAAAGGLDHHVTIWDVKTGDQLHRSRQHTSHVWDMMFSPDSRCLASAGWDGRIKIWDVATGKVQRELPRDSHAIAWSPDGQHIATGGAYSGQVTVWDAATGRQLRGITVVRKGDRVTCLRFSADGRVLAAGDSAAQVHVIETATWGRMFTLRSAERPASTIEWVSASAHAGTVAAANPYRRLIVVWHLVPRDLHPRHELTPPMLEAYWRGLAGPDAAQAYRGVLHMAARPEETLQFLDGKLAASDDTRTGAPAPEDNAVGLRLGRVSHLLELMEGAGAKRLLRRTSEAMMNARPRSETEKGASAVDPASGSPPSPPVESIGNDR